MDEQQATAQGHGGEETVLVGAYAVSEDTDEPQEANPGEGQQVQRQYERVASTAVGQPVSGGGILGHRPADQHERRREHHREHDAGCDRRIRR
jgi:hypothetical protein